MSDEQTTSKNEPTAPTSGDSSQPLEPATGAEAAGATDETEALKQQLAQQQQQYTQLQQAVNQYFTQQQQQQAAAQPEQTSVNYDDLEDEWLTSPGKASQRLSDSIQQNVLGQVQQMAGPLLAAQQETARATAKQDPKVREVFERYGSEIEQQVANLQPIHKANPKLWEEAANLVRSRHFDEFVNERAQQIAAQAGSQSETGTTGDGGRRTPSMKEETRQKLESSSYGRKLLDKYGAEGLRSHVNRVKRDLGVRSFEEYVDMVAQTEVVSDPENPTQWKNRSLIQRDR